LLRRGQDVDRAAPWRAFGDLKAADAMQPFRAPLTVPEGHDHGDGDTPAPAQLPGRVTDQRDPQAVFAGESLVQTLRQLDAYGRDGLPVLSGDGRQVQGWITNASVLQAVAREIGNSPPQVSGPVRATGAGLRASAAETPTPLPGYRVLEVSIDAGSPAAGKALGAIAWPEGFIPVSVLRHRNLDEPDPGLTLAPGDRVGLLAPVRAVPAPRQPHGSMDDRTDGHPSAREDRPRSAPATGAQP
jgi:chloride channel protein, CIC family